MTREEAIKILADLTDNLFLHTWEEQYKALHMAIEALQADAVQIVYCMDCAKSVPLDEHGALWKCKAHDRTTLRHSYCNNGERKGGQVHYYGKNADIYVIDEHIESEVDK